MTELKIYVARHGKTLMNTLNKMQGWCDSPLTQEGIKVAEYLGLGMKDIKLDAVYTSDLNRTVQTAKLVLQSKGQKEIAIIQKAGFKEACFGSLEAQDNHEMWGNAGMLLGYPNIEEMNKAQSEGKISYSDILSAIKRIDRFGIAESYEQVQERTQNSLRRVAKIEYEKQSENILIIAHGVSITAMLLSLGGDKVFKHPLQNASVCELTYKNDNFTVETMGDMSFVERGKEIAGN